MIPLLLQLKNFLSYGPETQNIDFSNYHLICLSGKNGHGKSALLDAITWAIWGQARKTSGNSKADQGLLHLGQKHMFVILEFEVNNQRYRIRREYVHTKSKPFASLDFGVIQESQKVIALTDKTIKATQDKIEKTIGITYDSFSNSTFLRQGQSNEFSKKSPKERKEILANILQLQQFEDQKKIALIHAKQIQQEYKTKLSIQQRIEEELNELTLLQEQYAQVKKSLQNLMLDKKSLQKKQTTLQQKKQILLEQVKEYELAQEQQLELQNKLQQTKQKIEVTADKWHSVHQKQHDLAHEKELKKEQKKLLTENQSLQKKLHLKLQYKEEYLQIKETLSQVTTQHESKYEKEINDLHITLAKEQEQLSQILLQKQSEKKLITNYDNEVSTIKDTLTTIKQELTKHQDVLASYQQQEQLFEKTKYQYQKLCAQGTILKQKSEELHHNLNSTDKDQTLCPLCEQLLNKENKKTISTNIKQEQNNIFKTITSLKEEGKVLNKKLHKQYQSLQQQKKQHEQSINLATKQEEYCKQFEKLSTQKKEHFDILSNLNNKEIKLQEKILATQKLLKATLKIQSEIPQLTECIKYKDKLKTIESKAKELNYNQKHHQEIDKKIAEINECLQSYETYNEEIAKQAERKAQLFELFHIAQTLSNQLQNTHSTINSCKDINHTKTLLIKQEQEHNSQEKHIESQHSQLLIQKGSLEQKEKKQKALLLEIKKINKEITSLHQELTDYQEIAKALGKDGIQALLIEQAIPEIENEANEVLARLTNNQTQIFIESLRDLKKGGNKETLDIKISDSFGLRDYELFSGGEAFRIDFALRIGISKLLARKAGTTLQTIFIDEGFGSQDEEGLQLIMENIYKIQDEFAKVIVVSHLQEMKEQFPVQFIVEKKRSGSSISIIEQG